jgi:ribonuclease E
MSKKRNNGTKPPPDLLLIDGRFAKIVDEQFCHEVRVAQLSGSRLIKYHHQSPERESLCGNIYWGRVVKQYKAMKAAFADIGLEYHGFVRNYKERQDSQCKGRYDERRGTGDFFQLTKDLRGSKRPVLTRSISLTGRYVVLHPNGDPARSQVKLPGGLNVTVRDSASGARREDIVRDAESLQVVWQEILSKNDGQPRLLYKDNDIIMNAVRDAPYRSEVVVEGQDAYRRIARLASDFAPDLCVKRHRKNQSLFTSYGIEQRVRLLYQQYVPLEPSGSVVISQTEAMVTIDVNSGSSKESAYNTNKVAAAVVAEQINLRNLSGLIIVDFIDMPSAEDRSAIHAQMVGAVGGMYTKVSPISELGTMEITRQRIMPSVLENVSTQCAKCSGSGVVLAVSCDAFKLLRDIRDSVSGNCKSVLVTAPSELVCYILNHQRGYLDMLEKKCGVQITVHCGEHVAISVSGKA